MEDQIIAGLGKYLRAEREKKQVTIEQIASATKINIKLLHALEEDNYELLPAAPFVRGFIKSYLKYLELNVEEILSQFDPFLDDKSSKKVKHHTGSPHLFVGTEGQSDNSKTTLSIVMVGFLVVAAILFVVIKPSLKHRHSRAKEKIANKEMITVLPPPSEPARSLTPLQVAPSTTALPPLEVKDVPPTPTALPELASPPAKPKQEAVAAREPTNVASTTTQTTAKSKVPSIPDSEVKFRLVVRADEDSWVKYQADDRPLQGYTLKKDKTIYIKARESIRFSTGNPKGISISKDNKQFHSFDSGTKVLIIPKEAEDTFKAQPFVTAAAKP